MSDGETVERAMWSSRTCGILFAVALGAYLTAIVLGSRLIRLHPSSEIELQANGQQWIVPAAHRALANEVVVIPGDAPPIRFAVDPQGQVIDPEHRLATLLQADKPPRIQAVAAETITLAAYIAAELGW